MKIHILNYGAMDPKGILPADSAARTPGLRYGDYLDTRRLGKGLDIRFLYISE